MNGSNSKAINITEIRRRGSHGEPLYFVLYGKKTLKRKKKIIIVLKFFKIFFFQFSKNNKYI